jgi:hypothetical protein
LLPAQAEVFTATSRILEAIGLLEEIEQSQDYRPVRPRLMRLNYQTQAAERTVVSAHLGSVSVVEATYLGRVFNALAMGLMPGSATAPQEPAKIS